MIIVVILPLNSCLRCDTEYINEAKNFDKDTALMYVWKDEDVEINYFYYFLQEGVYRTGQKIEELKSGPNLVWYTNNHQIYYRHCGEKGGKSDGTFGKYKIRNDSLFLTGYDSYYNRFDTITKIYTKVSKHP